MKQTSRHKIIFYFHLTMALHQFNTPLTYLFIFLKKANKETQKQEGGERRRRKSS